MFMHAALLMCSQWQKNWTCSTLLLQVFDRLPITALLSNSYSAIWLLSCSEWVDS